MTNKQTNKQDVTILINGYDLYEEAWEPFLKLFFKQWNDCPYPFVLNSNSIDYKGAYSDRVESIHPTKKKCTWSERLYNCLKHIDTDFVLFVLEDYFLLNPVSADVFEHAHSLMQADSKIGMAALSYGRVNTESGVFEDEFFYSRIIDENNRIWCRINLYRRDYLMKLIRKFESIWEFEQFASYRAKKLPFYIIQQKDSIPEGFTFSCMGENGYGISRGKWLPKTIELFEKNDIKVDFDHLGVKDFDDYQGELEVQYSFFKNIFEHME